MVHTRYGVGSGPGSSPCPVHDPVLVEGAATVEREGLHPACRGRRDVRPFEPHPHLAAAEEVVAFESAYATVEATDYGDVQLAASDGRGPPDAPPAGLGVEQTQTEAVVPAPAGEVRARSTGRNYPARPISARHPRSLRTPASSWGAPTRGRRACGSRCATGRAGSRSRGGRPRRRHRRLRPAWYSCLSLADR